MPRIRVMAQRLENVTLPLPRMVYRAEAYEDDHSLEPSWVCHHVHVQPLDAHECGLAYLQERNSRTAANEK